MVFTRSKARQLALESTQSPPRECETPQTPRKVLERGAKSSTRTSRKSAVIRLSPVATPMKKPVTKKPTSDSSDDEAIEQLALRALRAMRSGLRTGESETGNQSGPETEQPEVMLLESERETGPKKKSSSANKLHRHDLLPTALKPSVGETLYFDYSRKKGITRCGGVASLVWGGGEEVMRRCVVGDDFEKREVAPPMYVSKYARERARKEAKEKSAGKGWYEMKAPQLTPELQRDLKLLRMRSALDPSQHYKSSDWKKLPRFFQVGKVVSGPTDYSCRVPRRERKLTIMDELLHNHQFRKYQRKKYAELQRKFSGGARRKRFIRHKKHYKK